MLYDFVLSKPNIYQAIYSLESYVVEKYLLSNDDIILSYPLCLGVRS